MLVEELKKRILILDGAMGTMIQGYSLQEEDFRGAIFKDVKAFIKGNNDILSLTRPDVIKAIHYEYLVAGSNIIETNTFNANQISQGDYGLAEFVYEMNKKSALIAKEAIADYKKIDEMKPLFVAGSVGPTSKVASISPSVTNPGYRDVSFDDLRISYEIQIRGLVDGGVDLLIIETFIDGLNGKAAIVAASNVFEEKGIKLPIIVSGTISDKSGRILSGQTIESFLLSMTNENVIGVGMNCSFGAKELIPFIKRLSHILKFYISVHPNAGFRDVMGVFDEQPNTTATLLTELVDGGFINIVGGCCGTTPAHISAIAKVVEGKKPRELPEIEPKTIICGLEHLVIDKENNFVNIGERTNVAGSKKFARLIAEGKYEEALSVARDQVENGAQAIDINLDDAMLDAKKEMDIFLKMVSSEPNISKVPIVIDSSKWEVIEIGLKAIQGKPIVNSISLKEGKEEFVKKAKEIKKYVAAVVVMAFDEKGQADTFQRKIEVCKRAYDILVEEVGFPPQDIIFDPNILAIATGIEEHNNYAVDYIEAIKWIKANLPYAKISGGVSNLSFSFRGNNAIREAMHSVFLYHAIAAGMDMGIVNPGMLVIYEDIQEDLLERVEDVVLNRREDGAERLIEFAKSMNPEQKETAVKIKEWRNLGVEERLTHSIVEGVTDHVDEDVNEALGCFDLTLKIVEGPLMDGMNKVGDLFGKGKMFLPQVIKSARVMKKAVEILNPYIEKQSADQKSSTLGKILLATVKGDVHDIGKNIVGVVLACNNFEIVDMGIMVPGEDIIAKAKEINADIIGLSGLITPSLEEMSYVAELMEKEGFTIPLIIGGATTSKIHTAIKIEPHYSKGVIQVPDASKTVDVCKKLLNKDQKEEFLREVKAEYQKFRDIHYGVERKMLSLEKARSQKSVLKFDSSTVAKPAFTGVKVLKNYPIIDVREYIDWTFFFTALEMRKKYPDILSDEKYGKEASKLFAEANGILDEIQKDGLLTLNAVFGIFPAACDVDDIIVYKDENRNEELLRLNMLRKQEVAHSETIDSAICTSLCDYVAPVNSGVSDYIGAFVVSGGIGADKILKKLEGEGDKYKAIIVELISIRLAEAFATKLEEMVRTEFWCYDKVSKEGIRPAYGYPSCPDHSEKDKLKTLLDFENNIDVKMTENYMLSPVASVCGLYFAHSEAKYFDVGKIDGEQLQDYCLRKSMNAEDIKRIMPNRIIE